MSCNHLLVSTTLEDYLDGRLGGAQGRRFEEAMAACAQCREVHEQAVRLRSMAEQWQQSKVPRWHRTLWVTRPVRQGDNRLGWIALAASCCSLLLVLFRFELSVQDGLYISFGGKQAQQRMERQMAAIQTETVSLLGEELAAFMQQQDSANRLLLADWAESNRQERRQDMEFLMGSWEAQRFADRQRTEERLSYLARNQIESDQYLNELIETVGYTSRGPL